MESKQPTVLIDFKKNRVVISRKTLQIIGNPRHILLLVNPEERHFVVLQGDSADKRAHRIPYRKTERQREVEINSKSFMQTLISISDGWRENVNYKIVGEYIQGENILRYRVADAVPTK
ncbi:hypothetical protein FACS1894211_06790 [Clostridia bacterium]|nr:hypothetical protein FACS1894211_06790 [Clostridia bacterium]